MDKSSDAIKHEIETTQHRMGDEAEAIGYKLDVKARAHDKVDDLKANILHKKDEVVSAVTNKMPTPQEVKGQMNNIRATMHDTRDHAVDVTHAMQEGAVSAKQSAENVPIPLAIGGMVVGFLAGIALPKTSLENAKFGQVSDQFKGQAKEAVSEAVDRGKDVAHTALSSAHENVAPVINEAQKAVSNVQQDTKESISM